MSRKTLNHRFQFLDGIFRVHETGVNGIARVMLEFDVHDAPDDAIEKLMAATNIPDEQKPMVVALMTQPEMMLRYGRDITLSGWFDLPDDFTEEEPEPPDPDPDGLAVPVVHEAEVMA